MPTECASAWRGSASSTGGQAAPASEGRGGWVGHRVSSWRARTIFEPPRRAGVLARGHERFCGESVQGSSRGRHHSGLARDLERARRGGGGPLPPGARGERGAAGRVLPLRGTSKDPVQELPPLLRPHLPVREARTVRAGGARRALCTGVRGRQWPSPEPLLQPVPAPRHAGPDPRGRRRAPRAGRCGRGALPPWPLLVPAGGSPPHLPDPSHPRRRAERERRGHRCYGRRCRHGISPL
mmetsp:Transcript_4991/g.16267  ORF Transcript_4991/g.16267 Transcript_4991/m.16267 type:complete len:239 (-) Transcript_4991:1682-2398(-)